MKDNFRQNSLLALTVIFLGCGFGLMWCALQFMPADLPANALASWLHPAVLTFLTGLMGLVCSIVTLTMAGE